MSLSTFKTGSDSFNKAENKKIISSLFIYFITIKGFLLFLKNKWSVLEKQNIEQDDGIFNSPISL